MKTQNTTRPEWFVCEGCLFYGDSEKKETLYCRYTSRLPGKRGYFCENWTCRRCFQEWNSWEMDHKKGTPIFTDHSKCKPAVFK